MLRVFLTRKSKIGELEIFGKNISCICDKIYLIAGDMVSNINFVVREDGMSHMYSAESEMDFLITEEILKDYPYIIYSMEKEKYYIENEMCLIFDEILFENKVVGFATYEIRDDKTLLLSECFILPEFRGNRLFFDELCKMIVISSDFGILQPTKNIVKLLLNYAFAKNVNEDVIVSGIDFYFDDFDAKSNKRNEIDEDELPKSNFYDLGLCSTIFVQDDEVFYHNMLENDLRAYGSRGDITEDYLKSIKELFSKNNDEFEKLILELKGELPQEELGYDVIIGPDEGLSEYMQGIVDHQIISYDDAIEIKKQLINEYESGQIDDKSIEDRLIDLISQNLSGVDQFKVFKEILNSEEGDIEEIDAIKDFFDVIGDNEELGSNILNALMSDDENEFENLIINAMVDDEKFLENFLDLANNYGEEQYMSEEDFESFMEFLEGESGEKYKLDDTCYGKDYPISYDLDFYKLLSLLDNGADFNMIMMFSDRESSLNHDLLVSLLLDSEFIQPESLAVDWINSASEFSKQELKDILRENNLKVSGNKRDLLKRLADNNVTFSETYTISKKGKDYLKEFSWIEFYEEFLDDFDFNDFYRYWENHEGKLKDVSLNYLDEHIKLAKNSRDEEYLEYCILIKKIILDEADEFISDLNIPE